MTTPLICRAACCDAFAIPGHDFCDPHLEAQEEGQAVRLKQPHRRARAPRQNKTPGPRYIPAAEQKAMARAAAREVIAQANRPRRPISRPWERKEPKP